MPDADSVPLYIKLRQVHHGRNRIALAQKVHRQGREQPIHFALFSSAKTDVVQHGDASVGGAAVLINQLGPALHDATDIIL